MDEQTAGSSQGSRSIMVAESPGSPDILAPDSPEIEVGAAPEDSETYTEFEAEGSQASGPGVRSTPAPTDVVCVEARGRAARHEGEPPAKVRRVCASEGGGGQEEDGETCPVCLEAWGSAGEHRLVALKCGHLFGSSCIERWLRGQAAKDRSCPTCKARAGLRDLRPIYARRLVAADSSQLADLQRRLDALQADKSRVELELQQARAAHKACRIQLDALRAEVKSSRAPPAAPAAPPPPARREWRFALEKNMELCSEGGCRALAYDCRTYELYVSHRSPSALFPGYGVRRVSCLDYSGGQFIHLHTKQIRDLAYSQPSDMLLSAALDGNARLVQRGATVATMSTGTPLWSCAWDCAREHELYVGGAGGAVLQYDVRSAGAPLQRLAAGDLSSVVSLRSTPHGLLACHLNSCWLWQGGRAHAMPLEGPFMSLTYDQETDRLLFSCRASAVRGERARLVVCRLRAHEEHARLDTQHVFAGSPRASLLSRAAWVRAGSATWAATHSENEASLRLHAVEGARDAALPAAEPALDVCAPRLQGYTLLAALSDTRLRVYRALPAP